MHSAPSGWLDIERTRQANLRLGITLAMVAGATNAGGFLAVGEYTSHMTGIVSSVADELVLGHWTLAIGGMASFLAFLLGAMTTAWLVNWGLRRQLRSAFGLPLLLEGATLLLFGLFGAAINLHITFFMPLTVLLLCYTMGLQNAVITKISRAEIRTTHLTGLVTDLGIEMGKALYINRHAHEVPVRANWDKLGLQTKLISGFFGGAIAGALGFKHWGYITTVPLATVLLLLVLRPLLEDWRRWQAQSGR